MIVTWLVATNFGSEPFVSNGTSQSNLFLIISLTDPALLSSFSGFCVRNILSFVSKALAADPVKSLPSRKSWFSSGWTMTSSGYDTDVPFSPSKCTKMSARPVICWRAPVAVTSTVGTLFCFSSIFVCLASCKNFDVFMTVLAHPLSCSALIGNLSSLGEWSEPLISTSMWTSFASVTKFASKIKIGCTFSFPVEDWFWSWSEHLVSFWEATVVLFGVVVGVVDGVVVVTETFCAFDRGWAQFSFPTSRFQQLRSLLQSW